MSAPFPYGETVTVQRATRNRYGDNTYTDHHTISGCAIAPRGSTGARSSNERDDRRDTVITGQVVYAPFGVDVLPTDRLKLADGTEWHVEGDIGSWRSPLTNWAPGVEINIERVKG